MKLKIAQWVKDYERVVAALVLSALVVGLFIFAGINSRWDEYGSNSPKISQSLNSKTKLSRPMLVDTDNNVSCEPGDDVRTSDICAQWKAADAAHDAAFWAMVSTVLAMVGTFGLPENIRLTRKALRLANDTNSGQEASMKHAALSAAAAQRSAELAAEGLVHAKEVSATETRPWVLYSGLLIEKVSPLEKINPDDMDYILMIVVKNFGPTPAVYVSTFSHLLIENSNVTNPEVGPKGSPIAGTETIIAPGDELQLRALLLSKEDAHRIMKGEKNGFVYGKIFYHTLQDLSKINETEILFGMAPGGYVKKEGVTWASFGMIPLGGRNTIT